MISPIENDMNTVEAHGFKIPIVGLGTWALRDVVRMVGEAIRVGYRHVDTAQMYGNEAEVGEAVRVSGLRSEIMVTTKVLPEKLAPPDVERSSKESLRKLKLDAIDLLLIHWPNPRVPLADTLGAMAKLKREGVTRAIGVSNFTVALLEEAVRVSPEPIVCNQVECHPFLNQDKVIAVCRQQGIAVVAYSPVARGGASGNKVLQRIGAAHGKSAAQVSLRYLVQQGIVVIPRTNNVARLAEDIALFDFELTDGEMREIHALSGRDGRIVDWSWSPNWD
jgi:2,5-diketo-D-gluconate reductase B